VVTSILVNATLSAAGLVSPATFVWTLGIAALLAGSHLMASFRGMAPVSVFGPAGMPAMIFWYARPLLATLVVGTGMTAWGARIEVPWVAFSWLLLLAAFIVMWGLALVGKRDKRS